MKLLISRTLPERIEAEARSLYDVTLRRETTPMTEAEVSAALQSYDAILCTLGDSFSAAAIKAAGQSPRCRLIANFGVGYNHIATQAAKAAGIAVTNTPGAVTDATADIGMTLLLMTARRAAEGERLARSGTWTGWQPTQMLGQHVSGKTLSIIGMGRIGKAIAKRAHYGFGMEVRFFNRSAVPDPGLPATQLGTLREAMRSDFVVIAVPASPATRHLIDETALAAMPPQGILINIARGDIIDESALIKALQARCIAGAGLDVYEFEPAIPDALRALDNVTLLPHLGTSVLEVREDMGRLALQNIADFAADRPLSTPV
ncbi:2-hydroxyacid dehydrogenase [Falsigemmobacter faecalis]|uniref:D-glycerate dehydrogenase n=1 Tax=Falsigemmobacter faecalis TaxID=2488730 RepID=A0A3P3DT51_9RHOB|nr:D-glycerate dehydrogenase [Falsigemmobacter faecalis]RRH76712.1 D-glycerate dehydrogenase [Falsigemmobacter faecalis]